MSVGLLIISHATIGQAIFGACCGVLESNPIRTEVVSIQQDQDPLVASQLIAQKIKQLDHGDGVLVLTDMYGATPSNIICSMQEHNIAIVTGLNLPMLIRVMNYPSLTLLELIDKAISGGREGIMYCTQDKEHHVTRTG